MDKSNSSQAPHVPLLWLLLSIVIGYLLAIAGVISYSVGIVIVGIILLFLSFFLTNRKNLWALCFSLSATLLMGAIYAKRTTICDSIKISGNQAMEFILKVERFFSFNSKSRAASGIARVCHSSPEMESLKNHRIYFKVKNHPELFQCRGLSFTAEGFLGKFMPETSFQRFLYREGVQLELTQGKVIQCQLSGLQTRFKKLQEQWYAALLKGADKKTKSLAHLNISMLLGDKSKLSYQQRNQFSRAGTMHLFAVSGFHIGVLFGVLSFLLSLFPVPNFCRVFLSLLSIGIYILVIGVPPSAVRAFTMIACCCLARICFRQPCVWSAWTASAILLLLINPYNLRSLGFQMSFLIVGAILFYGLPLSKFLWERFSAIKFPFSWCRKLCFALTSNLGISWAATLVSIPFGIFHFGILNNGSLFFNLLGIPLAGWSIVLSELAVLCDWIHLTCLTIVLNHLSWWVLSLLEKVLRWANLPYVAMNVIALNVIAFWLTLISFFVCIGTALHNRSSKRFLWPLMPVGIYVGCVLFL